MVRFSKIEGIEGVSKKVQEPIIRKELIPKKPEAQKPKQTQKTGSFIPKNQTEAYVAKYFKPEDVRIALWVIEHESRGVANRISPPNNDKHHSKDYGLFQINNYWQRNRFNNESELLDAETNVRLASQIKNDSGWTAWTSYNKYYK